MNLSSVKSIIIPEGTVAKIRQGETILWQKETKETIINIIDTVGYSDNTRLSTSSGTERTNTGNVTTGYIELGDVGDIYRTSGVDFRYEKSGLNCLCFYDSSKTFATWSTYLKRTDSPITMQGISIIISDDGDLTITVLAAERKGYYIRITGYGSGTNLIVTKNQPIE